MQHLPIYSSLPSGVMPCVSLFGTLEPILRNTGVSRPAINNCWNRPPSTGLLTTRPRTSSHCPVRSMNLDCSTVSIPPQTTFSPSVCPSVRTRISDHLTTEAHDRPANPSLRLLAVLNVLSSTPALVKRRAPCTDAPLTHFGSPRGEKSGLRPVTRSPSWGSRVADGQTAR